MFDADFWAPLTGLDQADSWNNDTLDTFFEDNAWANDIFPLPEELGDPDVFFDDCFPPESIKQKDCELCGKPSSTSFGCPIGVGLHYGHTSCMIARREDQPADCVFPHASGPSLLPLRFFFIFCL